MWDAWTFEGMGWMLVAMVALAVVGAVSLLGAFAFGVVWIVEHVSLVVH